MNKKILFMLIQSCLLPMAQASEQQEFLSSIDNLSLPELPHAPNAEQPIIPPGKFLALPQTDKAQSASQIRVTTDEANLRKRKKTDSKQNPPDAGREIAALKQQLLSMAAEKRLITSQLKERHMSVEKKGADPTKSRQFIALVKEMAVVSAENQKLLSEIKQLNTQITVDKKQQQLDRANLQTSLKALQQKHREPRTGDAAIWIATSDVDKQSWALGLSLAGNIRKTVVQLKDLSIPYSEEGLKQGILAGIVSSKPAVKAVHKDLGELLKRYDNELDKRTKASIDGIRKSLKKQKIAKQNFSTFFVNVKKGKQVDTLENILFTLKTETFNGRKIDDVKDKPLDLNVPMPEVVLEALDEIGQGGNMMLYCLGADLYTDRTLPEGVFPYTPIKITLSTR
ncbi:hypothetical protein GJV04_06250 [Enterobacteriaceae bacterium RIT714]|nr:hypothetical protein [Enterobacteriaceae bacterium RIT714]